MRIGLGDINTLAAAIQKMEGYYPGSLAYTNNNPGNLVYAGQAGATKSCSSNRYCYAKFPDYDTGYNALLNQIQGQAASGQNLQAFIWQYAPPCPKAGQYPDANGMCPDGTRGNDTSAYLASLQAATGASADTPLTQIIGGASPAPMDTTATAPDPAAASTFDLGTFLADPTNAILGALAVGGVALLVFKR